MKTALIITGVILSPIILYGIAVIIGFLDMKLDRLFGLLYKKNKSEEKDDTSTTRTRYSHRQRVARYILLGAIATLFAVLSLIVFILDGVAMSIMMLVFGLLITLLPFFLCLQVWRSYEIIEDEGIWVYRIFSKRFVKYSDMAYYKKNAGGWSDLYEIVVFGADNKRLMWVYGAKVGMCSILDALKKHEIKRED